MSGVEHIAGQTFHGRRGPISNKFTYAVDYVLFNAEEDLHLPRLMSRNARNIASLSDRDHGGAPGQGRGAAWAREVLASHQLEGVTDGVVYLLTQPRVLGHLFNPVSFWLCHDAQGGLRAVIAEVNNTYGDRHSYLCVKPDRSVIQGSDTLAAQKIFYVSPFQPVEGDYAFNFNIHPDKLSIRIGYTQDHEAPGAGLVATLTGQRRPLGNRAILGAMVRRFGSRRVLALIHWQALKLWWRGAKFNGRPKPPSQEVSQ
ncbi:DUF1365 domain-containing protein [Roseinatronobacter bogoriensis]|uniref:DUF1365 domain-containing protein n=1 Tax=Roseinatronobacter bogoriensis subsp. barguzinensis TaxID=441209 RepID=A0A2K8K6K9_9RHOB|nr:MULTISPECIES: DUF1365 domain-containing protein [Rhodobaca]ATX65087.1 DUF1365 domain-containing protein [Rhodobaca barguzinensis]MBB4209570.1 hypothetical protein [Rhodobaca bogoriensis DSM 18756]TDW35438.1 hypothetical protein LY39_03157 [Rhodobaca barguzinensis]TDY66649.1 hypothetical protein EV660_11098 [Rhodobaca bogoriensis DSM 18756]